ncbi:MAG: OmpA family protein [Bryobacteraceae bacterium]|nr:OmpA family protein [Bryobacteraceae bacterium]
MRTSRREAARGGTLASMTHNISHALALAGSGFRKAAAPLLIAAWCWHCAAAYGAQAQEILQERVALSYPEDVAVKVLFAPTHRAPGAAGRAEARRRPGRTEINLDVQAMKPAISFGGDLNTYILWTLSPEGDAFNLGEIVLRGAKGQLRVTTPLTTFGMLVTAEPHFLVDRPSEFVVLENTAAGVPQDEGVDVINYRYAAWKADYRAAKETLADAPLGEGGIRTDRYQAIVAVRLADQAGAQQYAPEELSLAQSVLSATQQRFAQKADERQVALQARRTVSLAVHAQRMARERAEQAARAKERREHKAQIDQLTQAREAAEAAEARAKDETRRTREQTQKSQALVDQMEQKMLAANQEADRLARLKAKAEADARSAQDQTSAMYVRLQNALSRVAATQETERGLVVNLPDILFDSGQATLRPKAREVLSSIAGVLLVAPDYRISIEGHTDNSGRPQLNQRLSERRAAAVRAYLESAQISPAAMTVRGFGESRPVAANRTAAGRQQNRRVELIIEGLR